MQLIEDEPWSLVDGTCLWTTPHGRTYRTYPPDNRPDADEPA